MPRALVPLGSVSSGFGSGRQQHVERPQTAFPGREQQRREAPRGPRVQVGAACDQRPRRARVVLRGRPHQRRLAPPAFDGVDLGAMLEQHRDGGYDAGSAQRRHQRRLTLARRAVRVGPGLEQHPEHAGTAVGGGQRERGDAVAGRGVHRRRRPASTAPPDRGRPLCAAQCSAVVPSGSEAFDVDALIEQTPAPRPRRRSSPPRSAGSPAVAPPPGRRPIATAIPTTMVFVSIRRTVCRFHASSSLPSAFCADF